MADDSTTDNRNGFEELDLSEWRGMNPLLCGNYTSRTDFYLTVDGRYLSVPLRWGPHDTNSAVPFTATQLVSEDSAIACIISARYLRESCTPISAIDLPWHPWHEG